MSLWIFATLFTVALGASTPNFLLLFLDDHGWGDMGAYNPSTKETPNMDRLARSGMRFTDFHAGTSVCTPSRAAILTGRLGLRTGVTTNFLPPSIGGLPIEEFVLPELLPASYESHMIGKWHLGTHPPFHPSYRGFKSYYGLPYSNDMGCLDIRPQSCKDGQESGLSSCPLQCDKLVNPTGGQVGVPLYDTQGFNCSGSQSKAGCDETIVEQPYEGFSLHERYAQRARSIIKDGAETKKPFLLYIAFAHTHNPDAYNETRFGNASSRPGWTKVFGNTLAETDATIGEMIDALTEFGLENDTVIVLTADNGPADQASVDCDFIGSSGPYQGLWQKTNGGGGGRQKMTTWEGGHRVVGVASWPTHIPAGVTSDVLTSAYDVVPTFIAMAGGTLPTDRSYDGVDLTDVLLNNGTIENRVLFHPTSGASPGLNGQGSLDVMRYGKYKFFFQTAGITQCDNTFPTGKVIDHPTPLVFDLDADPGESTPVTPPAAIMAAAMLARATKQADIASTLKHVADFTIGNKSDAPCCNTSSLVCRCGQTVPPGYVYGDQPRIPSGF